MHIVLARLPDAPKGTRGISPVHRAQVPARRETAASASTTTSSCGSLEKKMGIKASATCVMNFDDAKGFLIGPPNKGLECMFTFMNTARIGTAMQGVGPAELSYQGALAYARERRSMRALSGKKEPDQVADAHHPPRRRAAHAADPEGRRRRRPRHALLRLRSTPTTWSTAILEGDDKAARYWTTSWAS